MTNVLVTGGGGFIGTHLANRLILSGHNVSVLERSGVRDKSQLRFNDGVHWLEGDFSDARAAENATRDAEVIFHLASSTVPHTSNLDPVADVIGNVAGSVCLIRAAIANGVRRFIFLSSGGTVYGLPNSLPIGEDHELAPISSYGISKLSIERYLYLFGHLNSLDYTVFRLSNPYGPLQRPNTGQGVISTFLDRVRSDLPLEVWGDGSTTRDYVYIGDAVDALSRAINYEGGVRTFNLGSGKGTSLNQLIELIEKVTSKRTNVVRKPARAHDVPSNFLDISLLHRELGWAPVTTLEEGLRKTFAFLTDDSQTSSL